MSTEKRETINLITNKLCADGYLKMTEEQYPVLKLTPKSIDVLKNQVKVYMKIDKIEERNLTDNELLELLKNLRKNISNREGLPPYIVFHDSTLKEIAKKMPTRKEDLLTIKGCGEKKVGLYGHEVCQVVINYMEAKGIREKMIRLKKIKRK